jgi:hypothetical protein
MAVEGTPAADVPGVDRPVVTRPRPDTPTSPAS